MERANPPSARSHARTDAWNGAVAPADDWPPPVAKAAARPRLRGMLARVLRRMDRSSGARPLIAAVSGDRESGGRARGPPQLVSTLTLCLSNAGQEGPARADAAGPRQVLNLTMQR